VNGDEVTLNSNDVASAFADANAGTNKLVTVTGLTLSGADAGQYTLPQPTATTDITPATITVIAETRPRSMATPIRR
jgi:hypothetical protein